MAVIGKIDIRYKDPALDSFLRQLKSRPARFKVPRESLGKYLLPEVTLSELERNHVVFHYISPSKKGFCERTEMDVAQIDEILFSSRGATVATTANTCLSIILYSEKLKIPVAAHVNCTDIYDPNSHRAMFLYAYANLRKLCRNSRIVAYIAGCNIDYRAGRMISGRQLFEHMIEYNRRLLMAFLPELTSRKVFISGLYIGRGYEMQEFDGATGEYRLTLSDRT